MLIDLDDFERINHALGHSTGDLVLQWTAADSSPHNVNFEHLFTGPITVAGGDGFTVTVDNGLIALGAMLIDVSLAPSGMILICR